MVDWLVYAFMFPVLILIASIAMLTGISGTAMMTPFLILVFPVLGVPTLTPAQAIGMALYQNYLLPVEIASVLLLVAMVGAVIMAKRKLE